MNFTNSLLKDKISNIQYRKNDKNIRIILDEVVGIDLNPIAILIAKFNYLLTVYPYLKEINDIIDIEIPIYLGDSSYTPSEEIIDNIEYLTYEYYFPQDIEIKFPKIVFPTKFIKNTNFLKVLVKVEDMVTQNQSKTEICEFLFKSIGNNLLNIKIKEYIDILIENIIYYQKKKLNTIWLFIFMNYYKPFALNKFDLIIGNPP